MELHLKQLLWPDASSLRDFIVILIFTLGAYGVVRAFTHGMRIRKEIKNIRKAEDRLDQWEKASNGAQTANTDGGEAAANPDLNLTPRKLDSRLAELESSVSDGTHIRKRISAIRRLRDRQVKLNLEILQQITLAAERTFMGMETARQVAGWALMLGVLGTFIGLSQMIEEIQIPLQSSSGDVNSIVASAKGVNGVFQGMGTVFLPRLPGSP